MANELNIALAKSGLTVTAQRYQSGAAVGSAISCPETGSTGFYSGNMTGTAGTYQVAFLASAANVGSGSIVWDGTAEVAFSTLTAAQVNAEADTALADVGLTNTVTGRIDATVSSRLTPEAVWGHASRTITGGLVDTATTLTNSPDVPTEAEIASAVWGAATKEITGGTVTTLTNAPTVPSAASIRAEIDSNSTQLAAIKSKTDALPVSPAATGDIPTADITAIKGKTDLLETTRLAQCSTVATTGAQLAAALS
jgi:hypothetical protein